MTALRFRFALVLLCLIASSYACAKRSHQLFSPAAIVSASKAESSPAATQRININTASAKQLEYLPGIGKGLAERIVEHREKHGPFRRAEHLIIVRGISDRRFRAIADLITLE